MTITYDPIRKRFRYSFYRRGTRHHGYCTDPVTGRHAETKTDARRIERALIAEVEKRLTAETNALPRSPDGSSYTLAECLAASLERARQENRAWQNEVTYVRELLAYFGKDRKLATIDEQDVEGYITFARQQLVKINIGGPRKGGDTKETKARRLRSDSTVNRYLSKLRKAWSLAYRQNIGKMPGFPRPPYIRELEEPEDLPNPIREEDISKILAVAPAHLYAVVVLAVHTGLRLHEILWLLWSEVDFSRRQIVLTSGRTKGKRGRAVPLNSVAMQMLEALYAQSPDPDAADARVILYRRNGVGVPRPIESVDVAWKTALRDAGIPGKYKFHNTRAAFCTKLAELGVDPIKIQEIAGHRDYRTTKRYVAIADNVKADAVALLETRQGTQQVLAPAAPRKLAQPTQYVGVYPKRGKAVYEAKILVVENGRKRVRYLGTFPTAEAAAEAYDVVARALPGRRVNFSPLSKKQS